MSGGPEKTGDKQPGRRWRKGVSGNPRGRPRGAKHRALLALDAIGQHGAQAVLRSVVAAARTGDLKAAEIVLRRVWPERRGRSVALDLPPLRCAADLVGAMSTVISTMAAGEVSPEEANSVTAVLSAHRQAIEVAELEARVTALESTAQGKRDVAATEN